MVVAADGSMTDGGVSHGGVSGADGSVLAVGVGVIWGGLRHLTVHGDTRWGQWRSYYLPRAVRRNGGMRVNARRCATNAVRG